MKLTHEEIVEIIWSHTDAINGKVKGIDEAASAIIEHEEAAQQSVQPTEPTCPECGSELEYWSCAKIKCGSHV